MVPVVSVIAVVRLLYAVPDLFLLLDQAVESTHQNVLAVEVRGIAIAHVAPALGSPADDTQREPVKVGIPLSSVPSPLIGGLKKLSCRSGACSYGKCGSGTIGIQLRL